MSTRNRLDLEPLRYVDAMWFMLHVARVANLQIYNETSAKTGLKIIPPLILSPYSHFFSYTTCRMLVHANATSPGKAKWGGPHQQNKRSMIPNSIVSHATLILQYHAFKLTIQNSVTSCALWLQKQSVILRSLECTDQTQGSDQDTDPPVMPYDPSF